MKHKFRHLGALTLAFLMLFSTLSFAVEMHYCGDFLVDYSLTAEAHGCGMEKAPAKSLTGCADLAEDCCSDVELLQQGDKAIPMAPDHISDSQQLMLVAIIYSYVHTLEGQQDRNLPYRDYDPPFIKRDVQDLHQTYLI